MNLLSDFTLKRWKFAIHFGFTLVNCTLFHFPGDTKGFTVFVFLTNIVLTLNTRFESDLGYGKTFNSRISLIRTVFNIKV